MDELRKVTEKIIAYSQQIPTSLQNSAINMTPHDIAKMARTSRTNVVFKFTTYGEPIPNTYQGNRFRIKQGNLQHHIHGKIPEEYQSYLVGMKQDLKQTLEIADIDRPQNQTAS